MAESAKSVIFNSRFSRDAWDALECQEGIQSSLITKLRLAAWNGSGSILTHRDYMGGLHSQLSDAGLNLTDQAFHSYFTESPPPSLDLFITFYDDKTYDVDFVRSSRSTRHVRSFRRPSLGSPKGRRRRMETSCCMVSSRPRSRRRRRGGNGIRRASPVTDAGRRDTSVVCVRRRATISRSRRKPRRRN